ncbi:hypothetical protein BpHYR1_025703 [Brachionus plicatilis]|uniref:Uncharacterized protein n=1 Tax=Brachionus plicatilis TaxID=10195 RepID=A0A3M7RFU6_BRAPC|nr:hypothetical protein BpHYR1_025703 [Brachionus plicatilis]
MIQKYFEYQISELNYNLASSNDSFFSQPFTDIRFKYYDPKSIDRTIKKNSILLETQNIQFDSYPNLIKDLDLMHIKRNIKDLLEKERKKIKKNFLNLNSACSPNSIVYTLPSNLELLEKLTCIEYLSRYTRIPQYRTNTVSYLFKKYKADDLNVQDEPYSERNSLIRAIDEFHGNSVKLVEEMMHFLDLNQTKDVRILDDKSGCIITSKQFIQNSFKFEEFQAIVVFSERYFSQNYIKHEGDLLEHLDFRVGLKKTELLKNNKKLEDLLKFLFN